jgi:hypothetical protein
VRRFAAFALPAGLSAVLAAGLLVVGSPAASGATGTSGTYHALSPTRILDTRASTGGGALATGTTRPVTVVGGAVPEDASAVVVTVTVTAPSAGGYLTVYPTGGSRPKTSTLNFAAGRTVPNLVVVAVGTSGRISVYNGSAGRSGVLVDVSGYFTGSTTPSGAGAFGSLPAPRRALDTRSGTGARAGAVGSGKTVSFTVTGADVPADASAVVLNLAVTGPGAGGYATVYPGGTRPGVSNLNFVGGQTVADLAVVPIGAGGKVTVYNGSSKSAQFLADISGYYLAGDPVSAGAFGSLQPARVLDTRTKGTPVKAGGSISVGLAGRAGVPLANVTAVVLTVTATQGSRSGHLTVYGAGSPPKVSNVNYAAGQTVPDLVVAPVSGGKVTIYNGSSGSVHVFVDVSGYVLGTDLTVPVISTSRYVRNVGGAFSDASATGSGCADAQAGSTFVLLDIGAQLNDKSGVALTVVDTRVIYPDLVAAVNKYLQSFAGCHLGSTATVALGTNNGGDFDAYPAADRGADWADKVVDAVTVPAGLAVVGANDIEAGFSSTEQEAEDWESAYLQAATTKKLIFNGSADGCPTTYGATNKSCAFGWTQANHYKLAGGLNPTQIQALPQIYLPEQAVQWADINATGGKKIYFVGALTERAACGAACSMAPSEGWAALYHSLSTLVAAPSLGVVTDLRIDP